MSEVAEIVAAVGTAVDARLARFEESVTRLLKEGIERLERDVKEDVERHSGELLRAWEEIDKLKEWKNQQVGGSRRVGALAHFFSGGVGGLIAAAAQYLTTKH